MTNKEWHLFFTTCARVLGRGAHNPYHSDSWCGWTTFPKLRECVFYWQAGLPNKDELSETHVNDGGTWGQPFDYQELAHIVIPRTFEWELGEGKEYKVGTKEQKIDQLSEELTKVGIKHRKTDLVLELKLY